MYDNIISIEKNLETMIGNKHDTLTFYLYFCTLNSIVFYEDFV